MIVVMQQSDHSTRIGRHGVAALRRGSQDIPTKGRMPIRPAFFGRNEITRRCYDLLREKGTITADDVTVRAMRDKGLDPEADRNQRTDFTRRILVSLHDLRRAGTVEKVGAGRGVKWKLAGT